MPAPPRKSAVATRPSTLRSALPQLHDPQPIRLGAVADGFLASGQRAGDGAHAHALVGELVELADLVLPPGLAVALEPVAGGHSGRLEEKGAVTK